jgi:hypothetical protein
MTDRKNEPCKKLLQKVPEPIQARTYILIAPASLFAYLKFAIRESN